MTIAKRMFVALLLILVLLLTGMVGVAEEGTSTAKVEFEAGSLVLLNPTTTHLNFDFGTHALPLAPLGAQAYTAVDDAYTLTVSDARYPTDTWNVKAALSAFAHTVTNSNTFQGIITMKSPTKQFKFESPDTNMTVPATITLVSSDVQQPVITLSDSLNRDEYSVIWSGDNVSFDFVNTTDFSQLLSSQYAATITWTLTQE